MPYHCPRCGQRCTRRNNLLTHLRGAHVRVGEIAEEECRQAVDTAVDQVEGGNAEVPLPPGPESLIQQLDRLIAQASLVQQLRGELEQRSLRLRPSVGSFSLVSYAPESPQSGFAGLHTGADLERALRNQVRPPGRDVPEKKLQAWLIREGYRGRGVIEPLSNALWKYWFVSDEIALSGTTDTKFVADLLLVRVGPDGEAVLVNAELKWTRTMEVFDQVIAFRTVLENPELLSRWQRFAEIMTGKTFQWAKGEGTHGIVVWPRSKNPENARANQLRTTYERVYVAGYYENESGYSLTFE